MGRNLVRMLSTTTNTRPWRAARQLHTAAEAVEPMVTGSPEEGPNSKRLYQRLSALRRGENAKKTLDNYLMEGNTPRKSELVSCVKELRKYKRFDLALQIMEWMESRKMNFGYVDHAIRLDLIAKYKGVPAAEDYLEGLPSAAKNFQTYGSLLNCYCKELMAEKALDLFQKMDEMKFLNCPVPFNNLMAMHLRLGQPEKVLELVKQIKVRKLSCDAYTYTMWMQSYGNLNDIEGVERVLEEMKNGGDVKCDWTTYSNLATIYVKAGQFEKAESALKVLEAKMDPKNREALLYLIPVYAGTSNLSEVHRVWNLLKSRFKVTTNISYLVLIPALSKLNDMDAVRKWFKEWESTCSYYDIRVVNSAIKAYLDHDMYEEAVSVFEGAMKRSKLTLFNAREMFMVFFLQSHQLGPALEHLNATISECEEAGVEWQLKQLAVDAFFNCFEAEKDVDGTERFCKILKLTNGMDSNAYHLLLKVYVAAGKVDPEMRRRLEEDNIEISPEIGSLLEKVCAE